MRFRYCNKKDVISTKNQSGVPYLTFNNLEEIGCVKHGFSTKLGGVSKGVFESMNLSYTRGDKEEDVNENFRRFSAAIGVEKERLVLSQQTHTNQVMVVKEEHAGSGIIKPIDYKDIDGLVTNVPKLCLATFYADCVPLFLVDPVHKAIGLSHSGWRGTVTDIGAVTVDKMRKEYGTQPEDLIVAIGPSICQGCYEVSEDVTLKFQESYDEKLWKSLFYKKKNGKYQLDLWKANEINFLRAGVKSENIAVTNICTSCNSELLFSHRVTKGERGNLGAFLALR